MASCNGFGKFCCCLIAIFALIPGLACAEDDDFFDGRDMNFDLDSANTTSAGIIGDVDIEGVAVINDKVYIDGVPVKKGTREVLSRKSGKTYRIEWGNKGNVTVTEK